MSRKPNHLCDRSVEFRSNDTESTDGRNLDGYAAVFNEETRINSYEGNFNERISSGAFTKTLSEHKPVMQFDHGHDSRVGSIPIGAFTMLAEDDKGLRVQGRLFDNQVVEPVRQAIEAGAVNGMSFRFKVIRDVWTDKDGAVLTPKEIQRYLYDPADRGPLNRDIKEVQLFEAGPVVYPAYSGTSVGVRSIEDLTEADRNALIAEYVRSSTTALDEPTTEATDIAVESDTLKPQRASVTESPVQDEPMTGNTPEDAAQTGTSSGSEGEQREAPAQRTVPPADVPEPMTDRKVAPMNREELVARLAEISVRMGEIDTEFRDAVLPEERQTEWDGLQAEHEKVTAQIAAIDSRVNALRSVAAAAPTQREAGSDRGAPAFHQKQENIYDLDAIRMASNGPEEFSRRLHDNAMRAVEGAKLSHVKNLGPHVKENDADCREFMADMLETIDDPDTLAKRMLLTGEAVYERAFSKWLRYGTLDLCSPEERQSLVRAQALGTDSAGGFAIPFQLDPTIILTNAGTLNPIRQLSRVERIVGKEWQAITSAGATASRGAEGSTVADGSFTIANGVVRTNRVQAFVPFNIEVELAWGALRTEITKMLMDAKDREEDSFITGDGTGTNPGGLIGSFNAAGGVYVTAGGTASFSAADVYALNASLPVRWESNAVWVGHKAIYHKLRQFDTAGGAQLWARVGDGQPPRLLDYPDYRVSAMASTLTTGNAILAHGAIGTGFLIVDRIGMTVELVPQLFDQSNGNRPTGQRGVYAIWMNNSKILVPQSYQVLKTG